MSHPDEILANISPLQFLDLHPGARIAYRHYVPQTPQGGRLYLQGLKSDMSSMKSIGIEIEAQMRRRCSCLRFDFQGQGLSRGSMSLNNWLSDAVLMLDKVCERGKQVVVGSSIGAWLALHLALQRPDRVKALVLIAPAVDVTTYWWSRLPVEAQQKAHRDKSVPLLSEYQTGGETLPLSFYVEGEQLKLLEQGPSSIGIQCPVRIFHGMKDSVVPYSCSTKLLECLGSIDIHATLIKDGDHRLSRAQDLSPIYAAIQEMEDY